MYFMSFFHIGNIFVWFFLLFKTKIATPCIAVCITELTSSGSQASGICAYTVLLFLHTAYYEPGVCSGVALSEIRRREMHTRKKKGLFVPICMCVHM